MPRETLRALDGDLARLLIAGAGVARTDDALVARRDALAAFGAKVPALARVAEQIDRVTHARPREAGRELLALVALARQIRGAQAQPAAGAGEMHALPRAEPIGTPVAPGELEPLWRALVRRDAARDALVRAAIGRDAVRDLRLLRPWIAALDDAHLADLVAREVVPRLGPAAVPLLHDGLDLARGREGDVRRLRCLAALEGEAARPMLLRAIGTGAPVVRAAAIRELASLDPAAAEPVAQALARDDRSADVRAAALEALGACASNASLEILLAALSASDLERHAARGALRAFGHAHTTQRVLALLTREALEIRDPVPPKALKGRALAPAAQKAQDNEREAAMALRRSKTAFALAVIDVLGGRPEPPARARLLEVWNHAKHPGDVRAAAGDALARAGGADVLDALASFQRDADAAVQHVAARAAIALAWSRDARTSYAYYAPWLAAPAPRSDGWRARAPLSVGNAVLGALLCDVGPGDDPRWAALCVELLGDARHAELAARVLIAMDHRAAATAMLERLGRASDALRPVYLDALVRWNTPGAAEAIAPLVEHDAPTVRFWALDALARLGCAASVGVLEARRAKLEKDALKAARPAPAAGAKKSAKPTPSPRFQLELVRDALARLRAGA